MQTIILTDLDGTLLDSRTYSFEPALPALKRLRELDIPLIICSSKTRAEIELIRNALQNDGPFVSENGGAVFVPHGYFDFTFPHTCSKGGYFVIELGADYATLRAALKRVQTETGARLIGFGDMSAQEISELTGLSIEDAELAKMREYDEPFIIKSGREDEVIYAIRLKGYHVTKGRFLHIIGKSNKGRAVTILKGLFRRKHGEIKTIALGDAWNDLSMLEKADIAIIVKKPDGTYDSDVVVHRLRKAEGIGPEGWNRAVLEILSS